MNLNVQSYHLFYQRLYLIRIMLQRNMAVFFRLKEAEKTLGWHTYIPKFEYCTDNAAMIGIVGYFKFLEGDFAEQNITAKARYSL